MKTLIEIPTRGDEFTQRGGIALRYNAEDEAFIVHNFTTDTESDTARVYFGGGYYWSGTPAERLGNAFEDLAERVKRAAGYDAGGSIDLEKLLSDDTRSALIGYAAMFANLEGLGRELLASLEEIQQSGETMLDILGA